METDQFKMISIRGRVAYAIFCLENALKHYSLNEREWSPLLDKLWSYTSIEFLDDWHMQISEYTSEAVLEDLSYEIKGIQFQTPEEYNSLIELYKRAPDSVLKLIDLVFYIGTCDLYGRLIDYSPNTLLELEKVIKLMEDNSIELPNLSKFSKFSYDEREGWGRRFEKYEIEKK